MCVCLCRPVSPGLRSQAAVALRGRARLLGDFLSLGWLRVAPGLEAEGPLGPWSERLRQASRPLPQGQRGRGCLCRAARGRVCAQEFQQKDLASLGSSWLPPTNVWFLSLLPCRHLGRSQVDSSYVLWLQGGLFKQLGCASRCPGNSSDHASLGPSPPGTGVRGPSLASCVEEASLALTPLNTSTAILPDCLFHAKLTEATGCHGDQWRPSRGAGCPVQRG